MPTCPYLKKQIIKQGLFKKEERYYCEISGDRIYRLNSPCYCQENSYFPQYRHCYDALLGYYRLQNDPQAKKEREEQFLAAITQKATEIANDIKKACEGAANRGESFFATGVLIQPDLVLNRNHVSIYDHYRYAGRNLIELGKAYSSVSSRIAQKACELIENDGFTVYRLKKAGSEGFDADKDYLSRYSFEIRW